MLKRELSKKAKFSVFQSIFVPFLNHGHESWITTVRMRSQTQASEIRLMRKIKEVTIFDTLCNTAIRDSLDIEYEKQNALGRGQLVDLEQDGLIISRILVGTV